MWENHIRSPKGNASINDSESREKTMPTLYVYSYAFL